MDLKKIILEYHQKELSISMLDIDPFKQFNHWMQDALKENISYPNTVTLATVDKHGLPQARIVLIKDLTDEGVIFFTNYDSAKGQDISNNNKVGLNIFWKELDRQIRINGTAKKISPKESEEYFRSRSRESQISAIVSPQSEVINKEKLLKEIERIDKAFPETKDLPMPKNWGGYLVAPEVFEFWQGRPNRFHDRFKYIKENHNWKIVQLGP